MTLFSGPVIHEGVAVHLIRIHLPGATKTLIPEPMNLSTSEPVHEAICPGWPRVVRDPGNEMPYQRTAKLDCGKLLVMTQKP